MSAATEPDPDNEPNENQAQDLPLPEPPDLELYEGPSEEGANRQERSAAARLCQDNSGNLIDDLNVQDLHRTYVRLHGREFAAAGREIPVAEIDELGLLMHHPDQPLSADRQPQGIASGNDEQGIVLNELGERRKIIGTRFHGREVFWHSDTVPGTTRHYVCWFDEDGNTCGIFLDEMRLTVDAVHKMRSRTIDGDLSFFPELRFERLS